MRQKAFLEILRGGKPIFPKLGPFLGPLQSSFSFPVSGFLDWFHGLVKLFWQLA
jgi:hypothetical protein